MFGSRTTGIYKGLMQFIQSIIERLFSYRRKLATAGVSVFAAYLAFHVMFGANGMVQYQRKRAEFKHLQEEVQQVQNENDHLQQQIKALQTDRNTIEKEAREQLKYVRPGEVIYVMPAPKNDRIPATATAEKR
jgi:cell division protein FtsB